MVEQRSKRLDRQYNRYAIPMEKRFDGVLVSFFNKQAVRLKNKYLKDTRTKQDISKEDADKLANDVVEGLTDWDQEAQRLLALMFPLYVQSGQLGNELSNLAIGLTDETGVLYSVIEESYLDFLSNYGATQVKNVTDGTKNSLKIHIRNGIIDGKSEKDIAEVIEQQVSGIGFNRAKTIARTETHNTFMATREINAVENGFEYWQWLTSQDERVRGNNPTDQFNHVQNDGVIVKVGELFPSGITRPGDPNGAAGNVINCRCEIIPVTKEEYLAYIA